MDFYKFDSNRDGTIDINEIDNYVSKNYKLSKPNFVKIKTAIFDGTHLIIQFDKKITNNDNLFESELGLNMNLETLFTLKIDGNDYGSNFIDTQYNTFNGSTLYVSQSTTGVSYLKTDNTSFKNTSPKIKLLSAPTVLDNSEKEYADDSGYTSHETNSLSNNDILTLTNVNSDYKITASSGGETIFKNFNIVYKEIETDNSDLNTVEVHSNNPNIEILNKDTLKIKLSESSTNNFIQKLNNSNNIKLYIPTKTQIYSAEISTGTQLPIINRTLKKSLVKIHKTINNFEEFDNSIFGK
jgi:hypothetical protein